jgi:hypothetical protein
MDHEARILEHFADSARLKQEAAELPEVEIASSTSPLRPSARTCFANTCSNA